ncbi:MAG: hypothetical protein LBO21_05875, partial [Synergistaceae bacterium]|jgi:hypothetical protein|nr:hypothetical protein [Synergistaceae bacterium]
VYPWGHEYFNISDVFSYGEITSTSAKGKIIGKTGSTTSPLSQYEVRYLFANTYYREGIGTELFDVTALRGADGFGTEIVKEVIKSKNAGEFASPEMAALLNRDRTGEDAPWEYVAGKGYPTLKGPDSGSDSNPGNGGSGGGGGGRIPSNPAPDPDPTPAPDPGSDSDADDDTSGGSTDTDTPAEPETPTLVVDRDDAEAPAVIVDLKLEESVKVEVDEASGVETVSVSVPEGTLTSAIDQAVEIAFDAGETESGEAVKPTIEIKVDKVPTVATEAAKVVKVEIQVSDLSAVAESEVEYVKIVTAIGEVTLDTAAMADLLAQTQTASPGAEVVEIDVERKETNAIVEDNTLTEEQKTVLTADADNVREVYDVSVVVNNTKTENFETTGELTIGLPYTLKTGEVPDGVWAVHIAGDGNTEKMTNGRKYERNTAYFKTRHLSVYAVTYELETDEVKDDQTKDLSEVEVAPSGSGGGCDAGAAMITLLAAAAFALTRKGRKD